MRVCGVLMLELECPSHWHTFSDVSAPKPYLWCMWVCGRLCECVWPSVCECVCVTLSPISTVRQWKVRRGWAWMQSRCQALPLYTLCCSTVVYTVNFSRVWISALRTHPYGNAYRCTFAHYTTGLTGLYSTSLLNSVWKCNTDLNAIEIHCMCVFVCVQWPRFLQACICMCDVYNLMVMWATL